MEKYIERDGQTLKIRVYYTLGGMNYFTSTAEKRGYYLSVSPVSISYNEDKTIRTVSYSAYSGVKELLKEVTRKSKKAEAEAEKLAEKRIEVLIEHVLSKAA